MLLPVIVMLLGDGEEVSFQRHNFRRLGLTGKQVDREMLVQQETQAIQAMLVSPLQGCVTPSQVGVGVMLG
jgi:hypothetical protein